MAKYLVKEVIAGEKILWYEVDAANELEARLIYPETDPRDDSDSEFKALNSWIVVEEVPDGA